MGAANSGRKEAGWEETRINTRCWLEVFTDAGLCPYGDLLNVSKSDAWLGTGWTEMKHQGAHSVERGLEQWAYEYNIVPWVLQICIFPKVKAREKVPNPEGQRPEMNQEIDREVTFELNLEEVNTGATHGKGRVFQTLVGLSTKARIRLRWKVYGWRWWEIQGRSQVMNSPLPC